MISQEAMCTLILGSCVQLRSFYQGLEMAFGLNGQMLRELRVPV